MRRFFTLGWLVILCGVLSPRLLGTDYKLTNGDVISGKTVSFSADGVVFSLDIGGFSPQIRWAKLSQEALKELSKDPKAAAFAEAFIDAPTDAKAVEKKAKPITVKPVETRLPHHDKIGFAEAWTTPAALLILIVLYAANLYAAYEIARFRQRPAGLVCGISAILPVLGPLVFLSLHTLDDHGNEGHVTEAGYEPPPLSAAPGAHQGGAAPAAAGLGLAASAKFESTTGGAMTPETFKRGDFTFNRRFVETKFSGFFRVVPTEAEKDLVLVVRTSKSEFIGKRISRVSSTDMHLQLLRGNIEQAVAYDDVTEFQIRHKDAKA